MTPTTSPGQTNLSSSLSTSSTSPAASSASPASTSSTSASASRMKPAPSSRPPSPLPHPPTLTPGSPQRTQLESLIPAFLDDSPLRLQFAYFIQDELSDDIPILTRNNSAAMLLRPLARLNAATVIDERTAALTALRDPTYLVASTRIDSFSRSPFYSHRISDLYGQCGKVICWYFQSTTQSVYWQFDTIARRRLLATDLAIQFYRADHGRWPTTLSELIPSYLPFVPNDPFGAPADPIGYSFIPSGDVQRPVIGCRNDHGLFPAVPPNYLYDSYEYSARAPSDEDRWIDVSSQPADPPEPATSQPSAPSN